MTNSSSLKKGPLDKARRNIIIAYLHEPYEAGRSNKSQKPIEYLQKMFLKNELFCWKCGEMIPIGSDYRSGNSSSRFGTTKKYYHDSCYERMFY